jgi:hypothetical protein
VLEQLSGETTAVVDPFAGALAAMSGQEELEQHQRAAVDRALAAFKSARS